MSEEKKAIEKVFELEGRLKSLETSMFIVVLILIIFLIIFNLILHLQVPAYEKWFRGLLEGEDLPGLLQFIVAANSFLIGLDLFFLATAGVLIFFRKAKLFFPVSTIFIIFLVLKAVTITLALKLPLISIVEKLGG